MYAVVHYAGHSAGFARAHEVYPRHRAVLDEFGAAGDIAMIGTFENPGTDGALCVFRSVDAARRFLSLDPFVVEEVVVTSPVRTWDPLELPDRRGAAAG